MIDFVARTAVATGQIALEMAPYIVIGLIAAVFVYAAFPKDRIQRWLGEPGIGSIFKAALAGIPLPLCSCSVVPIALSLKKQGASDGATVSFLVSEPETGIDSIAVTYALINPAMTVVRPVAAVATAVVSGLAVEQFAPSSPTKTDQSINCAVCGLPGCETGHSWTARIRSSFQYVVNDFLPDIATWLVIGIVLSGILAVLIPSNWFESVGSFGQMVMSVIIGIPLYICASASTPIAAVFLAKGMSPGAALVFLLVGPATNAASFLVIARVLGWRPSIIYLIGLITTSVAIGLLVNAMMGSWDWTPKIAEAGHGEHVGIFNWVGLLVLMLSLAYVWFRQLRKSRLGRSLALPFARTT